jgi:hypothetical protein
LQEELINKSKIGHLLKVQSFSVLQVLRQVLVHIESVSRQQFQSKATTPLLVTDCFTIHQQALSFTQCKRSIFRLQLLALL